MIKFVNYLYTFSNWYIRTNLMGHSVQIKNGIKSWLKSEGRWRRNNVLIEIRRSFCGWNLAECPKGINQPLDTHPRPIHPVLRIQPWFGVWGLKWIVVVLGTENPNCRGFRWIVELLFELHQSKKGWKIAIMIFSSYILYFRLYVTNINCCWKRDKNNLFS